VKNTEDTILALKFQKLFFENLFLSYVFTRHSGVMHPEAAIMAFKCQQRFSLKLFFAQQFWR